MFHIDNFQRFPILQHFEHDRKIKTFREFIIQFTALGMVLIFNRIYEWELLFIEWRISQSVEWNAYMIALIGCW